MTSREERLQRSWDRRAGTYDRDMSAVERRWFSAARPWVCGRATGRTLEVALGTGLNLPHYPEGLELTGVEWSPQMLAVAVRRAASLGITADLRQADARELPFDDASFDSVVSTFSLCSIPGERRAIDEMARVLRPGGLLLLADHVESSSGPVRVLQRLVDLFSVPLQSERYCHRPLRQVESLGFVVESHRRSSLGMLEQLAARRP
ncbi:class I SAM-dependent methyltransferase [Cellulomonas sp. URHE0023]|uniref:class I SAM-dependent methyltransferase n=1 Tax=Cellulomonas sp. URHE0023 TaxID=1380354 RepID=UPI000485498E|nr:class I SAM-dependent methyltransferase [Cellulomonas sp. URHE0023]